MFDRSSTRLRFAATLAASLLVSACMHTPGGVAPSNVPIDGRAYRVVGDTAATDSSIWILGILPVTGSNTTEAALREAINKRNADALIDITIEAYTQWWILWVRHVTEVRGRAIKFE